jgi:hypothetical protein
MNELEDELRRLANNITADTNFAANLEQALLKGQKEKKMLRLSRRYGLGFVAGLGMLVALTLAVPPLRTLAQEIIDSLFNQLDSDTTSYTYTVVDPPQTDETPQTDFDTIAEAEQLWGFNIFQPSYIPEGYEQTEIFAHVTDGEYYARQQFESTSDDLYMYFAVQQSSVSLDWGEAGTVGESAELIPVDIQWGNQIIQGEYVEGSWVEERRVGNPETKEVTKYMEWRSDMPARTMRWRIGDTLFVLNSAGHPPEVPGYIGQKEMIKIAESMYGDLLSVNDGGYSTVADAEIATGINVLEPSFIPEGFTLDKVVIPPNRNCPILTYKNPSRILRINQNTSACNFRGNEIGASAEIIPVTLNWGGEEIEAQFVVGEWMSVEKEQTGENEVTEQSEWRSDVPFRRLRWQIDSVTYEIYVVDGSHNHPGYIGQEEMVKIAESMYTDSVVWGGGMYSSIEDAEASMGMDIPEPEGIPCYYCLKRVSADGESFELVYADGYELIISRKLSQFEWRSTTDIGASAEIIPVQLQWGNERIEGEYVRGGWVVAGGAEPKITKTAESETRELQWENDLPIQALRWQQGEFRYEVYVKGGSPDRNWVSREAMIEIAESLY